MEHLRAKEKFSMRTAYVGSEFYFEYLGWPQLDDIKRVNLSIYWGWQGISGFFSGRIQGRLVLQLPGPNLAADLK